jgi:hypothetical protein
MRSPGSVGPARSAFRLVGALDREIVGAVVTSLPAGNFRVAGVKRLPPAAWILAASPVAEPAATLPTGSELLLPLSVPPRLCSSGPDGGRRCG